MLLQFENYVNYAGSKTEVIAYITKGLFENYVNYAGSKTVASSPVYGFSLRTM